MPRAPSNPSSFLLRGRAMRPLCLTFEPRNRPRPQAGRGRRTVPNRDPASWPWAWLGRRWARRRGAFPRNGVVAKAGISVAKRRNSGDRARARFWPDRYPNVTHNLGNAANTACFAFRPEAQAPEWRTLDPGFQSSITSNLNQMPLKARMRALSWWGEQWGVHKEGMLQKASLLAFMEPPHGPILRQCFLDNKSLLPRWGRR